MGNLRIIGVVLVGLTLISCEKDFVEEDYEVANEQITNEQITQPEKDKIRKMRKKSGKTHKIDICHGNGKLINVGIPSAFSHLNNGGQLFSCDSDEAITYEELMGYLKIKVFNEGGNFKDPTELENAFEDWYINDYLTGTWDAGQGNTGGTGSGGIGGGSL